MKHLLIEYGDWIDQFHPKMDTNGNIRDCDPRLLDAPFTNEELNDLNRKRKVWTMVDADGEAVLVSGYHTVNMMSIHVCSVPFAPDVSYTELLD